MKEHMLKMAESWAEQAKYDFEPEQALIWCTFYLWAMEEVE